MESITLSNGHAYSVGNIVSYKLPENRWYVKLWFFVTFRKCPDRTFIRKITSCSSTTFTF